MQHTETDSLDPEEAAQAQKRLPRRGCPGRHAVRTAEPTSARRQRLRASCHSAKVVPRHRSDDGGPWTAEERERERKREREREPQLLSDPFMNCTFFCFLFTALHLTHKITQFAPAEMTVGQGVIYPCSQLPKTPIKDSSTQTSRDSAQPRRSPKDLGKS